MRWRGGERAATSEGRDGIKYLPHPVCLSSMLGTWVMLCTAPSWPSPHFACRHKHAGDSEKSIEALPPSTFEGRRVVVATCQSADSRRELHGERQHAATRLPRTTCEGRRRHHDFAPPPLSSESLLWSTPAPRTEFPVSLLYGVLTTTCKPDRRSRPQQNAWIQLEYESEASDVTVRPTLR